MMKASTMSATLGMAVRKLIKDLGPITDRSHQRLPSIDLAKIEGEIGSVLTYFIIIRETADNRRSGSNILEPPIHDCGHSFVKMPSRTVM